MKSFIFVLFVALLCSCVTATVTEPATCKSNVLTFTTGLPDVSIVTPVLPPITASTQVDMSDIVGQLNKSGNVSVQISKNLLSSTDSLGWVKHLTVQVSGVHDPVNYPIKVLADQDVNTSSNTLDLVTVMDGNSIYNYLSQGAIQLDFTVIGTLPNTSGVNISQDFCTSDVLSIDKSL